MLGGVGGKSPRCHFSFEHRGRCRKGAIIRLARTLTSRRSYSIFDRNGGTQMTLLLLRRQNIRPT